MTDANGQAVVPMTDELRPMDSAKKADEVVSTHVLVAEQQVEKLRELSRRTRVAQSEYLREAVDDLLVKYEKLEGSSK
jgi:hypothetical protein